MRSRHCQQKSVIVSLLIMTNEQIFKQLECCTAVFFQTALIGIPDLLTVCVTVGGLKLDGPTLESGLTAKLPRGHSTHSIQYVAGNQGCSESELGKCLEFGICFP